MSRAKTVCAHGHPITIRVVDGLDLLNNRVKLKQATCTHCTERPRNINKALGVDTRCAIQALTRECPRTKLELPINTDLGDFNNNDSEERL